MIVLIRPQHLPDSVSALPLVDMLHPPNYLGITVIFICFVSCIKLYMFFFKGQYYGSLHQLYIDEYILVQMHMLCL
jgi:hypothetical protein